MASRDGVFPRFILSFMLLYGMPGVKMHAHPRSLFSTSNFMCCRPRLGSSRSLCTYFTYFPVLKLGEIKSILGIGPALIEIIGIFSENFSNFIWWGVSRGMGVMIVVLKFLVSSIRNGEIASACIFWQNDRNCSGSHKGTKTQRLNRSLSPYLKRKKTICPS